MTSTQTEQLNEKVVDLAGQLLLASAGQSQRFRLMEELGVPGPSATVEEKTAWVRSARELLADWADAEEVFGRLSWDDIESEIRAAPVGSVVTFRTQGVGGEQRAAVLQENGWSITGQLVRVSTDELLNGLVAMVDIQLG